MVVAAPFAGETVDLGANSSDRTAAAPSKKEARLSLRGVETKVPPQVVLS
jgi:hypothetical protein